MMISRNILIVAARYCSAIAGGTAMSLSSVRDANIDPQGTFKYILIKVQDKTNKNEKLIVRGYKKCPYHMDIFDETSKELPGYNLECLGGGRIKHDPTKKEILVYGYSQGYGKADHQKSVDILKKQLPDYKITFSDEGY
ncbi:hypothetical protein AB6A40_006635 [Gnathostoma spinigerum]|uniref:Sex-regulated protein janus-B n=1 Tax=Gnathostoma spinigerum TaxID=75299 RepID=A0ABD6EJJ4_9BILA